MKYLIRKANFVPVLLTFFVMGFCDVVGIATSYIKTGFQLSETVAGFIPSMVFIWFLLLSVPSALLMDRIGRKRTVQLSNVLTFIGMLIPLVSYNLASCIVAFILLGIGNTILQVSLNPLLTNVVSGKWLTSCLTAGQVIKAISSFCGPFIALFAVSVLGEWRYLFPVYAVITLVCWALLLTTEIVEDKAGEGTHSSFASAFGLLKDRTTLLLFFGILFIVGVDVGTNTVSAKLLMERAGLPVETAGLGASVYFVSRTVGAFIGTFFLARINEVKYMRINMLLAVASLALLFFAQGAPAVYVGLGGIGFFCSSIFSVIFSQALKLRPRKANEISGFMITGVCGGAVVPPLMGILSDAFGSQAGSLVVIGLCMCYLVYCSLRLKPSGLPLST